MIFWAAAGVVLFTAVLIAALMRSELKAPRVALDFEQPADKVTALGCPAALFGVALLLGAFTWLAAGW